ncbi:CD209 antigen-like protein C isoform X1 [Lates calcarifer]|uniref:CD209 antigen-like protein C isoform X1 n=2 Tax=Lates calcarifer TaxID=8187 RepID=A0AAJ7LFH0_LATCA|nr:CD209 antigen-like protein C isoform X1 [Lates calcarifer]
MDNRYKPDASARMRKLYRLAGVSLGLLFILQAALNISLRLTFHVTTPDFKGIIKNLTEEREELKRELNISDAKTSDFEAMIKNLTEERDELKRKLNIFDNYIQQRWVYFKHSFYYISSTTKSWPNSRNDCLQRGADLVIINSKEEQEFMRRLEGRTWIGLTDRETEGTWRWVDGTFLSTSYWITGEPNSYEDKNEDCVEIRNPESEDSWNDAPCTYEKLWICEKTVAF